MDILERDKSGHCEGECRNRDLEGRLERQREIVSDELDYVEDYPKAKWAADRDIQPGVYGGHI